MSAKVALELADGANALEILISDIESSHHDWNEAETRFRIIDRLIIECFGWSPEEISLEKPKGRNYTDYELGNPANIIWEAKREGKTFEIPVRRSGSLIHKLSSIMMLSGDCSDALVQVNSYCLDRGVSLAVASNGHQIIAFNAIKEMSLEAPDRCIVFSSLAHLRTVFPRAWQLLSPGGVASQSLPALLQQEAMPKPPEKLSSAIPGYPQVREPSDIQRSMMDVAEMVLLNIEEQGGQTERFYRECYCESGALGQHALISKQMLNARYNSLFPDAPDAPKVNPVSAKGNKPQLTPEILAEAISNRPIALIGDVGVGKTSFLKHLMFVSAFREFQHAIYVYINLGRRGALSGSIADLVLDQIDSTLIDGYEIDIYESSFVRSVYKKDISRFERSIWGEIKETDPESYKQKLLSMLDEKQDNKSEHIRRSVNYLSKEKRKQIIIALDNADQRSHAVQQDAFIIAQNLSSEWSATVFISVRPKTFFLSKRSGTLAAYPHRIFTIAPPRIDQVIEKRLRFALSIAEGKVQLESLGSISFRLNNVASIIKVIINSIDKVDDTKIFLENITGGNIREIIQFIVQLFGNPNVDMIAAIHALEQTGEYIIPVHDFWKVALKGSYNYFDNEKALAANIYDVYSNNDREHFLIPILLAFLDYNGPHKNSEGFVDFSIILKEMQEFGYSATVVEAAARRANNKRLIEAPDRITFEEDEDGLFGLVPVAFRLNTVGAYHLKIWMTSFPYLDAMCVDTPIFRDDISDIIKDKIRSASLEDRYERAVIFRDYLTSIWSEMSKYPAYFDWESLCKDGDTTFLPVSNALVRRGKSVEI